jgi:hypothetical protein
MGKHPAKNEQKWRHVFFLSLILLAGACRSKVRISPPPEPTIPSKEVKQMGFTIQAGAFSILNNAIRLTESLNKKGINAYYFLHESGLYKVRFGDFLSRKTAQTKAQSLVKQRLIDEFYIVSPEEYSFAKKIRYGKQYLRDELVTTAKKYIGLPYSWGGFSADKGFDCSGLTMAVYQLNGLFLPHSSEEQFKIGTPVDKNQMMKGDLVFFATSRGTKVTHVGIYAGNDRFIHAPGKDKLIRTDSLSNSYYKKRYKGARTYLN